MFDGYYLPTRLLDCFVDDTETPAYNRSANTWARKSDRGHTAKLLEHLVSIGKSVFVHHGFLPFELSRLIKEAE